MKTSKIILPMLCLLPLFFTGCAVHYTTPGGGVSIAEIDNQEIKDFYSREPASTFPARMAIIRVQDRGYVSETNSGYGNGKFSVVTTRDIETDDDFQKIRDLPSVKSIAPLTRLLLPPNANSIEDLRKPAASLKTDLLLIYSIDTSFNVEGTSLGPLSLISLGFIPNKKASVTSTVSGALVDVRTGYIYGTSEATANEQQRTTVWSTHLAIDNARMIAEKRAFGDFIESFEKLWQDVIEQYAARD